MTPATQVGLVIVLAMASPMLLLLPLWWEVRRTRRRVERARAEYRSALRAYRDELAAMPLMDRIAHDDAAVLVPEVEAWLREVTR